MNYEVAVVALVFGKQSRFSGNFSPRPATNSRSFITGKARRFFCRMRRSADLIAARA